MKGYNFLFGKGIDKDAWFVTTFYYDIHSDMFNIVVQKGAKVEQLKLTPQALEDVGILSISNINTIFNCKS